MEKEIDFALKLKETKVIHARVFVRTEVEARMENGGGEDNNLFPIA